MRRLRLVNRLLQPRLLAPTLPPFAIVLQCPSCGRPQPGSVFWGGSVSLSSLWLSRRGPAGVGDLHGVNPISPCRLYQHSRRSLRPNGRWKLVAIDPNCVCCNDGHRSWAVSRVQTGVALACCSWIVRRCPLASLRHSLQSEGRKLKKRESANPNMQTTCTVVERPHYRPWRCHDPSLQLLPISRFE